jgi:tRNA (guanine-N7-)-methyltransferase
MFLKPQSMDLPLKWDSLFPQKRPLAVEIGFGNGKFLRSVTANMDVNAVGFEVSLLSIEKALNNIDRERTALIFMDGVWGLRELFEEESVDTIFINFPLPWPHKKHASRRLFTEPKIQIYASRLKMGGSVQLQTDVEDYATEAAHNAAESGLFLVQSYEQRKSIEIQTKYEQKWVNQGKKIYKLVLEKRDHISVPSYLERGANMPHAIIADLTGNISETVYRTTFGTIKVWEPFHNNNKGELLIPAVVSDDDFIGTAMQQRVYVTVVPHFEGYIVKLDNHSEVFKTENVKALIWILANQLSKNILRINVNRPSDLEVVTFGQ